MCSKSGNRLYTNVTLSSTAGLTLPWLSRSTKAIAKGNNYLFECGECSWARGCLYLQWGDVTSRWNVKTFMLATLSPECMTFSNNRSKHNQCTKLITSYQGQGYTADRQQRICAQTRLQATRPNEVCTIRYTDTCVISHQRIAKFADGGPQNLTKTKQHN